MPARRRGQRRSPAATASCARPAWIDVGGEDASATLCSVGPGRLRHALIHRENTDRPTHGFRAQPLFNAERILGRANYFNYKVFFGGRGRILTPRRDGLHILTADSSLGVTRNRMKPAPFQYVAAQTIEQALAIEGRARRRSAFSRRRSKSCSDNEFPAHAAGDADRHQPADGTCRGRATGPASGCASAR